MAGLNPSLTQLLSLKGRVAIVTGGSRGLGLQVAAALGEFGARDVLIARDRDALDEAVAELGTQNIRSQGVHADISDRDVSVELANQVMQEHGRIDILVNNAGAAWGAPAEDYPDQAWDKIIILNVTGLFALTRAVARVAFLPEERGAVLNIASTEGLKGHHPSIVGTIAYNAAKGAVVNLTRPLAAEWGPKGVRVNAIAPGYFPTKMTRATLGGHRDRLLDGTPLGKLGGPNDLKGAALLLASDAGGHITGQILVVDGGASVI